VQLIFLRVAVSIQDVQKRSEPYAKRLNLPLSSFQMGAR
jgi:hypothetical protein